MLVVVRVFTVAMRCSLKNAAEMPARRARVEDKVGAEWGRARPASSRRALSESTSHVI